jgi:8-oxo-dGTP pyrophosphatase MutT (NUDIX family)
VKNDLGKGVVNAIRKGLQASRGWVGAVVTMADLSDPPAAIPAIVAKLREGCDVVAGSRYMRGGSQHGGPFVKRTLSRLAGVGAYYLTGVGIHDVTTNFRGYSRRLIETVPIESAGGFELGVELTAKAHLSGWRVGETPASWHDRSAGESRFRLWKWLPGYLRWYLMLLWGDPFGLGVNVRRKRRRLPQPADYGFFAVNDKPGYGWTAHRRQLACVIVPVTAAGKIVMERLHRPCYDTNESYWELPGGGVDDRETPLACAQRELLEETGYTSVGGRELEPTLEALPGMGCTPHRVVVLSDCRKTAAPTTDEGIVEVAEFSLEEIAAKLRAGEIRALPTVAGVTLYTATQRS